MHKRYLQKKKINYLIIHNNNNRYYKCNIFYLFGGADVKATGSAHVSTFWPSKL